MAKRVPIDRLGRVVIPKAIRDRYGLHAGSEVAIVPDGDRISLEPVVEEAVVEERDGILIIASDLVGEPVTAQTIRDERLDRLAGNR
jgi:AbrB family transcriptional regulator (stage V sporulation protein T)